MFRVLAFLALTALLSAASAFAHPLEGLNFELTRLPGAAVPAEKRPTLSFADGKATGMGGCNRYGALAEVTGKLVTRPVKRKRGDRRRPPRQTFWTGAVQISNISATRMHCGPASAFEGAFFDRLKRARAYRLGRTDLRLLSGGPRPTVLMTLRRAD